MPTPAGDPLRKVTLNLYEQDCQIFERVYGRGWTSEVRDFINISAQGLKMATKTKLGDLDDHS